MDLVEGWGDLHSAAGVVLTIGVFDGVHLGHQALIRGAVQQARALGGLAAVLTFHPHPRAVVAPESSWGYLCSLEERIARIAELGPDALLLLRFDAALAATSAEDFLGELRRHMPLHTLYVGADFSLGRDRQGNLAALESLGARHGFAVWPAPQVCLDGQPVSSTRIRELVQSGQVDEAARWLGRPFSLRGEVVRGAGQGRSLGFATANLHLHPRQVLPADGVYAARVSLPRALCPARSAGEGNPLRPALAYVGRRPTFGPGQRAVEVHLLGFSGDLLGHELRAEFVAHLRPDRRFAGAAELAAQIRQDAGRARDILAAGRAGAAED